MNYTVVFDVLSSGYRQWWFPALGLLFVAIGTALLLVRRRFPSGLAQVLPYFFLTFSILWTTIVFVVTFGDYRSLSSALRERRCQVVEGMITDFNPMPYSGHQNESFNVDGRRFAYSDYNLTAGFNRTRSHGGPIGNGIRVRIHYLGSEIARLEIAY